jgi:hypothetical protein
MIQAGFSMIVFGNGGGNPIVVLNPFFFNTSVDFQTKGTVQGLANVFVPPGDEVIP